MRGRRNHFFTGSGTGSRAIETHRAETRTLMKKERGRVAREGSSLQQQQGAYLSEMIGKKRKDLCFERNCRASRPGPVRPAIPQRFPTLEGGTQLGNRRKTGEPCNLSHLPIHRFYQAPRLCCILMKSACGKPGTQGRKNRPAATGMVRPPTNTLLIFPSCRLACTVMREGRRISSPCSITAAMPLRIQPF